MLNSRKDHERKILQETSLDLIDTNHWPAIESFFFYWTKTGQA